MRKTLRNALVVAVATIPVVGSARPVEHEGEDLLVLNINSEGQLRVYGQLITNVDGYIRQEAQASLLSIRKNNPNVKADDLPSIVVIRADKRAAWDFVAASTSSGGTRRRTRPRSSDVPTSSCTRR